MKRIDAIISIHDVSPRWQDEVERAVALIHAYCDIPPALLVVPDFHRRSLLRRHSGFTDRLQTWLDNGSELFLHGYTHLDEAPISTSPTRRLRRQLLTAGEGEFLNLDEASVKTRLDAGLAALAPLGHSPVGFVPPAWLYNRHMVPALKNRPLAFFEGHFNIYHLPSNRRFLMPAVSFCARDRARSELSAYFTKGLTAAITRIALPSFRLALHPVDFTHPRLVAGIETLLKTAADRVRWMQYRTLLDKSPDRQGRTA